MNLPERLEKGFRADLKRARWPRRRKTIVTVWTATIRDELGVDWGGQAEREIKAELERIEAETKATHSIGDGP